MMYPYEKLKKAHDDNDRAVMEAYGWKPGDDAFTDEGARVSKLKILYGALYSKYREK